MARCNPRVARQHPSEGYTDPEVSPLVSPLEGDASPLEGVTLRPISYSEKGYAKGYTGDTPYIGPGYRVTPHAREGLVQFASHTRGTRARKA